MGLPGPAQSICQGHLTSCGSLRCAGQIATCTGKWEWNDTPCREFESLSLKNVVIRKGGGVRNHDTECRATLYDPQPSGDSRAEF